MKVELIAPEPTAKITGGNLYNLGLMRALRERGVEMGAGGVKLVDSLYLNRVTPGTWLLLHYLPSLVDGAPLSELEKTALTNARTVIVPSVYLRRMIASHTRRVVVIAPARISDNRHVARRGGAVLVGNVTPGKGVLPLLALAPSLPLRIIGSLDEDRAYAEKCRAHDAAVEFCGALPHEATLDAIAAADFLVSASRMESYGLALAEARGLGVPIVARRGGNVATHVDPEAGGQLVDNDEELAVACLRLAGNRDEMARRRRAAQRARPPARSWSDAARELLDAFKE
jgi:glycosyltransferase involved in cell wall biosynthesis